MDIVRIFKIVVAFLLAAAFLLLLLSAYQYHREVLQAAGLIDASSAIASSLTTENLAYLRGERSFPYVIDPSRIRGLSWSVSIGGENFAFNVRIVYRRAGQSICVEGGPGNPEEGPVSAISLPVAVFENFRFEAGELEVRVWRERTSAE